MEQHPSTARYIDVLNIGLLIISFVVAIMLPFELFLFSYVISGPLHYLTELNWLKTNNYFVLNKQWIWVFVVLSLIVTMPALLSLLSGLHLLQKDWALITGRFIARYSYFITIFLFVFAACLVYFKKWWYVLLSFVGSLITGYVVFTYMPFYALTIGVFLPTLVHVYAFTLLLMLVGALQADTKVAYTGVVLLLLCSVVLIVMPLAPSTYIVSGYTQDSYLTSRFANLSTHLAKILHFNTDADLALLSVVRIKIQIFIAFCYTYHYLNWFSKTSVIGWSRSLSRGKLFAVLLLWVASVSLYLYNFKLGYTVLFFFSFIHVVLEFPLNVRAVKLVANRLKPARGRRVFSARHR